MVLSSRVWENRMGRAQSGPENRVMNEGAEKSQKCSAVESLGNTGDLSGVDEEKRSNIAAGLSPIKGLVSRLHRLCEARR